MPIPALRAKQSTTTTGTGTVTLLAAPAATRSFNAAFGASSRVVKYCISGSAFFELGIGTFDGGSPGTLTRSTVLASSNAGALVSLPAGTADVFAWLDPGERALIESTATTVNVALADLGNFLYWTGTAAGTVNLPAIATVPLGADFEIRNDGTALLTLDPNGAETINGATTLVMAPGHAATLRRVTAGWVATALEPFVLVASSVLGGVVSTVDFSLPAWASRFRLEIADALPSGGNAGAFLRFNLGGGFLVGATDYFNGSGALGDTPNTSVFTGGSSVVSLANAQVAAPASDRLNGTILFSPGSTTARCGGTIETATSAGASGRQHIAGSFQVSPTTARATQVRFGYIGQSVAADSKFYLFGAI